MLFEEKRTHILKVEELVAERMELMELVRTRDVEGFEAPEQLSHSFDRSLNETNLQPLSAALSSERSLRLRWKFIYLSSGQRAMIFGKILSDFLLVAHPYRMKVCIHNNSALF